MPDDTAKLTVGCPSCQRRTTRDIGWFKTVRVWDCSFCGAALELDPDALATFLAARKDEGVAFTARLSPRPNRGITTRRTR
ncbi:MAG TPA: hypothetical protein VGL83_07045 [Stellaceae bacterium]|jgi:hypothetical protein